MPKKSRGPMFLIADRARFAAQLRGALREQKLNQSEAAARIGITQPQMSKLLQAQLGGLREETLQRVLTLFSEGRKEYLAEALISPAAREARKAYTDRMDEIWFNFVQWRAALLERYNPDALTRYDKRGGGDAIWAGLLDRIETVCARDLAAFRKTLERRGHLGSPAQALLGSRDTQIRYHFAIWRVLEPFNMHEETSGFERGADELSDAEFRRFVLAGLKRELILLNRAPDVQRAQQIGGDGLPPKRQKPHRPPR